MDGTIYEIRSVKPRVKTKLLIFGEAQDTILNLIIGENVQTYIKVKASDLIKVLEEMKLIDRPTIFDTPEPSPLKI